MELEEMKVAWTEMSAKMETQKKLTDKLIMDMTKVKYHHTLNKIANHEILSSLLCIVFIVFTIYKFNRFDTLFLQVNAIITIALYIILPALSLWAIKKLKQPDIGRSSFKEVMEKYHRGRIRFLSVQKASFVCGIVLMFTTLPLMIRAFELDGKFPDYGWYAFMILALFLFWKIAKPIYDYYVRTISKIEDVLKELE